MENKTPTWKIRNTVRMAKKMSNNKKKIGKLLSSFKKKKLISGDVQSIEQNENSSRSTDPVELSDAESYSLQSSVQCGENEQPGTSNLSTTNISPVNIALEEEMNYSTEKLLSYQTIGFEYDSDIEFTPPQLTEDRCTTLESSEPPKKISGRRIVDIGYLFEQIQSSEHKGGFGCSFMSMEFVSEKRHGLRSSFKFICRICNVISIFESEKSQPDNYLAINNAAVSGSLSIGVGHTQLSKMFATLDIPCMSHTTFFSLKKLHEEPNS